MAGEWCDTTLGQVTDFLSGGTPSKDAPEYWGGSTPWVSAKDMKQFRLDDTQDHVTEDGVANCPMTFNQDVKALRPKPGVRDDFLPYLLLGNTFPFPVGDDSARRCRAIPQFFTPASHLPAERFLRG